MKKDYYIVERSALPEYFGLVLKAKALVDDEKKSVSDACRIAGISRNTFYKYIVSGKRAAIIGRRLS